MYQDVLPKAGCTAPLEPKQTGSPAPQESSYGEVPDLFFICFRITIYAF